MSREELDKLWQKALHESIAAGEKYARYHFAAMVAAAEREGCHDDVQQLWGTRKLTNLSYVEGWDDGLDAALQTIRGRSK